MTTRRNILALGLFGGMASLASLQAFAATECATTSADAQGAALLDKYLAAVNAHDTSSFPEIFTEAYIQHSGRTPSGLAAQIENFRQIFAAMPDHRWQIDDRILAGDKVVARSTRFATHTRPIRGIPPTGKPFSFQTIDIWRVDAGKFAEHWDLTDAAEVLRQLSAQ